MHNSQEKCYGMELPPCMRCEDDENAAYRFQRSGDKAFRIYGTTNEDHKWLWVIGAFLLGLALGYWLMPMFVAFVKNKPVEG